MFSSELLSSLRCSSYLVGEGVESSQGRLQDGQRLGQLSVTLVLDGLGGHGLLVGHGLVLLHHLLCLRHLHRLVLDHHHHLVHLLAGHQQLRLQRLQLHLHGGHLVGR